MVGRRKSGLTAREQRVMDYLRAGLDSREIAALIGLDLRTTEAYRSKILKFTGAKTTAKLVAALHEKQVSELKARITELEFENEFLRHSQTVVI